MIMKNDLFLKRHLGPVESDLEKMLSIIGVKSKEQLIDETVPPSIRLNEELDLPEGMSEYEYLQHIKTLARKTNCLNHLSGWDITTQSHRR